ncbi:MAG: hypothetical protein PUE95_03370 [Lachnospiraceae bacterium]|nr:hypothetical protein [Lachnospiraceae bacterium]MDD6810666.1 hypothetical protein [Lachnospiraceae bacterium]
MRIQKYLMDINRKLENIPRKYMAAAVVLVYAILHLLMAIVHEPFFDEAEAWQIARSASLQTLLTQVPHYEGHPPLWHLILMPFAKAGAPYELSLTLISLIFTGTAVYLILRNAPFPIFVRILLPFTYFFFYQYGVISRVYCVMLLEFVLLAIVHKDRNTIPGRYVSILLLLCMTNAYGIVLAGGISAVWLLEIWHQKYPTQLRLKKIICDRRILYLSGLLLAAIMVILQIMPRKDTYAMEIVAGQEIANPFWKRLLYMIVILPADVTMTNVFSDYGYLSTASLSWLSLLSGCMIGILIWGLIVYFGIKKNSLCLFIVPYLMFAVFASSVYVSLHHIGIGLLFLIFWIWISLENPQKFHEEVKPDIPVSFVKTAKLFVGLSLCISLSWTISACVLDIGKEYSAGRSMAEFIKSEQLDRYRIMAQWDIVQKENGETLSTDVNFCYGAVEIAPYFPENIVYNFNFGRNDRNYITHIRADKNENDYAYAIWKTEGYPDILLMKPELNELYSPEELNIQDYVLVYYAPDEKIWKNVAEYHRNYIYIKKSLLQETGLEEVKVHNL